MAKRKLKQIALESNDDQARPPLPGGWALAVFEAINTFAPALADKYWRPSRRTQVRLRDVEEEDMGRAYNKIEGNLVSVVASLFPKVSGVNNFARKYVKEYFLLWTSAAEIAPQWIRALGHQPELTGVLVRALVRDFAFRLCYLESCERVLSSERFADEELDLLRRGSLAKLYDSLVANSLAKDLGTYQRKLRRFRDGEIGPEWKLLGKMGGANNRMLAGIGFMDVLIRTLKMNDAGLEAELMYVMEIFLSTHHAVLKELAEVNRFKKYASFVDNLLLHRGLETMRPAMPDALWRAHLNSLQGARMVDLAQAYCQYSTPKSDRKLRRFLEDAERKSDGCPDWWTRELQRHKNGGRQSAGRRRGK